MPRAKENSYIFVSPGFVWPLQACRIGVLLRVRDVAKAVTGRNRAGRVEKAGGREKGGGFGGRGAVVETLDLIRLVSPPGRTPHLSLCHKHIPISTPKQVSSEPKPGECFAALVFPGGNILCLELDRWVVSLFSSLPNGRVHCSWTNTELGANEEGFHGLFSLELSW